MLRKFATLLLVLLLFVVQANAQYADLGNGKLKNSIWWIDFNGFSMFNGASKTITTTTGLEVTIKFSNILGVLPNPTGLNTWPGAVLQTAYNFSDFNIKPALLTPEVPDQTRFVVTISATKNGKTAPVNFVVTDAEASARGEQIRLMTSGSEWQMIDLIRNSDQNTNPFIDCGTKSAYITETIDEDIYPEHKGQVPIVMTQSDGNPISVQIIYDKQPPHGASAIAMGILEAVDMGDLPSSYGDAFHHISYSVKNPCSYTLPFPSLQETDQLLIGKMPGDADVTSAIDDNDAGVDEDGLTSFPIYDGSGTYELNIPVKNTTGKTAYFSAWFDFNRDGEFTDNEQVTLEVPVGSTSLTVKWTGIPSDLLDSNDDPFAFRFRISSDKNAINLPTGYAPDGEVEDYFEKIEHPVDEYLIINNYAAVQHFERCFNELTLDNSAQFNVGDTVLLIQMKGAVIDISNSTTFGNITDYQNTGNYEFNIIKSKDGNKVRLLNELVRDYDFVHGRIQLIRVPYFSSYTNDKILTAAPWDGFKGGILALNVAGTFSMGKNIDVSGKGFRHGEELQNTSVTSNADGYFYNAASNNGGEKGEGIATIPTDILYGRGAPANGGGGGNAHNAGGGGGGNGGKGGDGGDQYEPLKTISESIGGKGGKALTTDATLNRIFMGGAGGMGQANDLAEFPAGNGGGIIIISAGNLASNEHTIMSNGENGTEASTPEDCKDGMPGGGAGGTILLNINTVSGITRIEAKGGKGADQTSTDFNGKFGSGGGGGGGVIAISQASIPAQLSLNISGGMNGVNTGYGNDPWGATPGQDGITVTNFSITTASEAFSGTLESINFSATQTDCLAYDFSAEAHPSNNLIADWEWDLGDGQTDAGSSISHIFENEDTFDIRLIVTSTDGCQDSVKQQVITYSDKIDLTADTAICENNSVQLIASEGQTYSWAPADGLSDVHVYNPFATPATTATYTVTVEKAPFCIITDNVTVTVNPTPDIEISNDTTICMGSTIPIFASGGTQYQWTSGEGISDPDIANPDITPTTESAYHVFVTDALGCTAEDEVNVSLFTPEKIQVTADTEICKDATIQLSTTGGSSFSWAPVDLIETTSGNTATTLPLSVDTQFYVDITDQNTCKYHDSIEIKVRPEAVFSVSENQKVCQDTTATLIASGGDQYRWTPTVFIGNPNAAIITATPTATTTFAVEISENTCGKTETLYTTVEVLPPPSITTASTNDITCTTPYTKLQAYGTAVNYNWSNAESLNNSSISGPIARPQATTTYSVTGTDTNGCSATDSITVIVDFSNLSFVGMPNAFTPNGDGLNDCFGFKSPEQINDFELKIYNRFGQLIFKTNDPHDCWDGRFKGEPQDAGDYVYTVKGETICQRISLKGTVVLIR